MTAVNKKGNAYASEIDPVLYQETPKAVFAAIVASIVVNQANETGDARTVDEFILEEWSALHANGIVPQKPPKLKGV